jgi:hypothetical protein
MSRLTVNQSPHPESLSLRQWMMDMRNSAGRIRFTVSSACFAIFQALAVAGQGPEPGTASLCDSGLLSLARFCTEQLIGLPRTESLGPLRQPRNAAAGWVACLSCPLQSQLGFLRVAPALSSAN